MPDSSAASSVHGLLPATRRQLAGLFRQDLSSLLQTAESTSDPPRGLSCLSQRVSPSASAYPKLLLAHLEIKTSARWCSGAPDGAQGGHGCRCGVGRALPAVEGNISRLLEFSFLLPDSHWPTRCDCPSTPFCLPGAQKSSLTS